MASVSFSILRGADDNPDAIVSAADAPANANSIEVRIDIAAGFTSNEVKEYLDAIFEKIVDGRLNVLGQV